MRRAWRLNAMTNFRRAGGRWSPTGSTAPRTRTEIGCRRERGRLRGLIEPLKETRTFPPVMTSFPPVMTSALATANNETASKTPRSNMRVRRTMESIAIIRPKRSRGAGRQCANRKSRVPGRRDQGRSHCGARVLPPPPRSDLEARESPPGSNTAADTASTPPGQGNPVASALAPSSGIEERPPIARAMCRVLEEASG